MGVVITCMAHVVVMLLMLVLLLKLLDEFLLLMMVAAAAVAGTVRRQIVQVDARLAGNAVGILVGDGETRATLHVAGTLDDN